MINLKALFIILFSIFAIDVSAVPTCGSFFRNYKSKKIYSQNELHAIEQLASAILAARIGPKGFEGLVRHNIDNLDQLNSKAILEAVTPEQKQTIQKQVKVDIANFFQNGGDVIGVPISKYKKANFGDEKGYFTYMRYLVLGRNRKSHESISVEIENFLHENIDSIMVNASIMKHQNRLVTVLKRDVLGTALLTGLPITGALAVTGGIENTLYSSIAALYVSGMTISEGIRAYRKNVVTPIWSPQVFDSSIGQSVRLKYSFE